MKRLGTPDDIAHAVAFFLDERSSFITGQVLYACGGITVGLYGGG
jgi:NAD(P)-dependent dehydrogenase (short-subunit alcohol dehydrogenase family)